MIGETVVKDECYTFDIEHLEPGDILLSRIPMNLNDASTWDSHLIQAMTRSSFSFATLHLGNGLFIEGVGSGVARLPIIKAAVRDSRNVRLLRVRKNNEWRGRRVAAAGLRYLQRGFCRVGAPQTKCCAFHNVQKASVASSSLVANAYLEAEIVLNETKPACALFPGDILKSPILEDATSSVLKVISPLIRSTFHLDDHTLYKRLHHWEVITQLKVLCNQEVRRIIDIRVRQKPSSMRELEAMIAKSQWRALDKAIYRSLKWYRYSEIYHAKQAMLFGNPTETEPAIARLLPSLLSEDQLATEIMTISDDLQLLDIEAMHWQQQRDYYADLLRSYEGKTFSYMHDLYSQQIIVGEKLRQLKEQQKYVYKNEAGRRGLQLKIA